MARRGARTRGAQAVSASGPTTWAQSLPLDGLHDLGAAPTAHRPSAPLYDSNRARLTVHESPRTPPHRLLRLRLSGAADPSPGPGHLRANRHQCPAVPLLQPPVTLSQKQQQSLVSQAGNGPMLRIGRAAQNLWVRIYWIPENTCFLGTDRRCVSSEPECTSPFMTFMLWLCV